jgi:hypothetical protein
VTGTATQVGNRTIYRDASGRIRGSADKNVSPVKSYGMKKSFDKNKKRR